MTKKEFYDLSLDTIVYDDRTNGVFRVNSHYTEYRDNDKDAISLTNINDNSYNIFYVVECEHWHESDETSPMEVKFKILYERFFALESFVYDRLK